MARARAAVDQFNLKSGLGLMWPSVPTIEIDSKQGSVPLPFGSHGNENTPPRPGYLSPAMILPGGRGSIFPLRSLRPTYPVGGPPRLTPSFRHRLRDVRSSRSRHSNLTVFCRRAACDRNIAPFQNREPGVHRGGALVLAFMPVSRGDSRPAFYALRFIRV